MINNLTLKKSEYEENEVEILEPPNFQNKTKEPDHIADDLCDMSIL